MLPKTIAKLANDPRVESISDERGGFDGGDGIWVYLKPGFMCTATQTHCVHEWTVLDVLVAWQSGEPCNCKDCRPNRLRTHDR